MANAQTAAASVPLASLLSLLHSTQVLTLPLPLHRHRSPLTAHLSPFTRAQTPTRTLTQVLGRLEVEVRSGSSHAVVVPVVIIVVVTMATSCLLSLLLRTKVRSGVTPLYAERAPRLSADLPEELVRTIHDDAM